MHARNSGSALDLGAVERVRVNQPAVARRAASHAARRTVKTAWQAAWLAHCVGLIDLTTLDGADTPSNVQRLCAKAASPVRPDILQVRVCAPCL